MNPPPSRLRRHRTLVLLLATLAVVGLVSARFGVPIQQRIQLEKFLRMEVASDAGFRDIVARLANPAHFLQRCWDTGKTTHRQLVLELLKSPGHPAPAWLQELDGLPVAGALAGDLSIREVCLALLANRRDPQLASLASAQLRDVDPMVRLLGLQHLGRAEPQRSLPALIRLLDDPDLQIRASTEVVLRRWTKVDFGVRSSQAVPREGTDNQAIDRQNEAVIDTGIAQRKAWWQLHRQEYAAVDDTPSASLAPTPATKAGDFKLPDLPGKTVHLSDFRGKVVLLNFWTTWCPGCIAEMPVLNEFQSKHADQLVVLGISLDGVPDDHGHLHGEHSEELEGALDTKPEPPDIAKIRGKIERFVTDRKLNYRILLDPLSEVGGRYNGGELPTNVFIDADGVVRRRFIGARSLPVLEAMLAELAGKP